MALPPECPYSVGYAQPGPKSWTGITCGNEIIASLDYASAQQSLQGNCDGKTKLGKKNYYAIYNSAMAFMCNYSSGNVCTVGAAKDGTSTHMFNAYDALDASCSATLTTQKSNAHMTGCNRVSNSLVWGLIDATSSACEKIHGVG